MKVSILSFGFCGLCIFVSCFSGSVLAQKRSKESGASVLDFEADRIGGERSGPFQTFFQGTQGPSFDSLLYLRKDFLDFQKLEFRTMGRGSQSSKVRERVLFRREAGDFSE